MCVYSVLNYYSSTWQTNLYLQLCPANLFESEQIKNRCDQIYLGPSDVCREYTYLLSIRPKTLWVAEDSWPQSTCVGHSSCSCRDTICMDSPFWQISVVPMGLSGWWTLSGFPYQFNILSLRYFCWLFWLFSTSRPLVCGHSYSPSNHCSNGGGSAKREPASRRNGKRLNVWIGIQNWMDAKVSFGSGILNGALDAREEENTRKSDCECDWNWGTQELRNWGRPTSRKLGLFVREVL